MVGNPSEADYTNMVRLNLLKNNPVTTKSIKNAHTIFGPDIPALKGKQVRKSAPRAETNMLSLPAGLEKMDRNTEVCGDIMFINGLPFLTSISRRIYLRTSQHIAKRKKDYLSSGLTSIVRYYESHGFNVGEIHMDREFEPVRDKVQELGPTLVTTGKSDHVPEAERNNRTIKERV